MTNSIISHTVQIVILFFINPYLFENNFIDLIFFLIFNTIIYIIVLKKSIVKIFERSF